MRAEVEPTSGFEVAGTGAPRAASGPLTEPRSVSVLIAARNRILGEALADVLSRTGYRVHLAPSCAPRAVVSEARSIRPALVLLDLPNTLPNTAIAETIADLRLHDIRVVVLGPNGSPPSWTSSIPVDGWASRSDQLSSLLKTVKQWAPIDAAPPARDSDPAPRRRVRGSVRPAHESRFDVLTSREQQVLMSLMDGTPPVKIASQSFMSESTVRHHIRSILLKLDVKSQLAAVVAAYQAGWPPALRATQTMADRQFTDGPRPTRSNSRDTQHDRAYVASKGERFRAFPTAAR